MDQVFVRLIGVFFVIYWAFMLLRTIRHPADWEIPVSRGFPIRLTRARYIGACILGIVGGFILILVVPALVDR